MMASIRQDRLVTHTLTGSSICGNMIRTLERILSKMRISLKVMGPKSFGVVDTNLVTLSMIS